MLPWRQKVMHWIGLHDNSEHLRSMVNWLALLERRQDDMSELMDELKKKVAELTDAVAAIHSSVAQLRAAYEDLRDHPRTKDDPELATIATQIGDLTHDLAESVAKAGASGGV